MVGVAIVSITLAAGAPSFSSYLQSRQIRNAAEAIQNGLNLARSEAVRRNTYVQFALANDFSWTVGCATASTNCPAAIQTRPATDGAKNASVATSQVVASTGSVAGTAVFTNTLSFNGFGKVSTLPAGNNAVLDISNPTGGTCATTGGTMRCLRVVVSPGGQIRMCDAKLASSNPQAC